VLNCEEPYERTTRCVDKNLCLDRPCSVKDSNMAAAMTMHPPSIRPPSISLATSPTGLARFNSYLVPADSQTYGLADNSQNEGRGSQCDGCRRRNSRCAMNLASNKCYSCDFHRQDCVFTPHTSRKRSYPQPMAASGKKRYAPCFSPQPHVHTDRQQ
jgi:hypothetical protein